MLSEYLSGDRHEKVEKVSVSCVTMKLWDFSD